MKFKSLAILAIAVIAAVGIWFALHRSPRSLHTQVGTEEPVAVRSSAAPPPLSPNVMHAASPSVQVIVDSQEDYRNRTMAANSLSTNLTPVDFQVIESFLIYKDPADNDQRGQVLKNELLNALCALNPPPPWLADALIQIYADRSQNVVVRDYVVQHMVELYRELQNDPQGRQGIQRALLGALTETEDSIAGTALLSLEHLSKNYPEFDRSQIIEAATRMAEDDGVSELVRITSFQVCAELGASDTLPVILRTAQTPGNLPVRISAVAALGLLAGTDEVPFLNSLVNGNEDRLKPAAQRALDQIAARRHSLASQK